MWQHKPKIYLNWSSGKDAAMALYYLQQNKEYSVEELLITVNAANDRVSMHGLRSELLLQQIQVLGIPHSIVPIPTSTDMQEYEQTMMATLSRLKAQGFYHSAFGDILLDDLRQYREQQLAAHNIKAIFPLWHRDTKELLHEFIDKGFKAIVVCVSANKLDQSFVGRMIDSAFIADLPEGVDPCGEHGEYHSFCFDGPIFSRPIPFAIGRKYYTEYKAPKTDINQPKESNAGFWFCDLIPTQDHHSREQ